MKLSLLVVTVSFTALSSAAVPGEHYGYCTNDASGNVCDVYGNGSTLKDCEKVRKLDSP